MPYPEEQYGHAVFAGGRRRRDVGAEIRATDTAPAAIDAVIIVFFNVAA